VTNGLATCASAPRARSALPPVRAEQSRGHRALASLRLSDTGSLSLGYQPRPDDPFGCVAALWRFSGLTCAPTPMLLA